MLTAIWMIYLADIVCGLTVTGMIFSFSMILGWGAWMFAATMEDKESRPPRKMLVWAFGVLLALAFLPSRTTLYAAAAYNVGSEALQTETGNLTVQAINAWLRAQIVNPQRREPTP